MGINGILLDKVDWHFSMLLNTEEKTVGYCSDCSEFLKELQEFSESGSMVSTVYLRNAKMYETFYRLVCSVFSLRVVDLPYEEFSGVRYFTVSEFADGLVESMRDYDRVCKYLRKIGVDVGNMKSSSLCPLCDLRIPVVEESVGSLPFPVKYCPFCGRALL